MQLDGPVTTRVLPGVSCGFACSQTNPLVLLKGVFSPDQCRSAGAHLVKWSTDHRAGTSLLSRGLESVRTPNALLKHLHFPAHYAVTMPVSVNMGIVRAGGNQFRQSLSVNRRYDLPHFPPIKKLTEKKTAEGPSRVTTDN